MASDIPSKDSKKDQDLINWERNFKAQHPTSRGGQLASMFLALCLLAIVGTLTAVFVHWLIESFW